MGDVHGGEQLIVLRVILLDVLGNGDAIAYLGSHCAPSLVHELQVSRGAIVHRVVGVHGERVGVVVVCASCSCPRLCVHHTVAGGADRMLIHPADDAAAEPLQGQAYNAGLQALRSIHSLDESNTRVGHALQELSLLLLTLHQFLRIKDGHVEVFSPGLSVLVQGIHDTPCTPQALLHLALSVQRLADVRSESMEPSAHIFVRVCILCDTVLEVHDQLFPILRGLAGLSGVLVNLEECLCRLPVEVLANLTWAGIPDPCSVEAICTLVLELDVNLLAVVYRSGADNLHAPGGAPQTACCTHPAYH
mmetsp:Transcript_21630/g.34622  ORF Transcript_21630/g.34622 Transcript_21630/m.34622 type:complete len:305 (-) Transcript_21630:171-1085(-)